HGRRQRQMCIRDRSEEAPPATAPASPLPAPAAQAAAETESAETEQEPAKPSEGAEVVRLDRFRKK
ncbi:hypothetical protein PMN64_32570, partial [Bradyrhizobium sp. UFLA01-814]